MNFKFELRLFFVGGFFALAIPYVVPPIEAQEQGQKSQEQKLNEMMEILYVNPKLQSPVDKVEINGSEAFIQVWRDLPQNPVREKVECLGYQWLLSGRGEKMGMGAIDVFQAFPQLRAITLQLVELEDQVKSVDKKGKLQKDWKATSYLKYRLERDEILKFSIDRDNLKKNLRRDQASCLKIGRRVKMDKEINL